MAFVVLCWIGLKGQGLMAVLVLVLVLVLEDLERGKGFCLERRIPVKFRLWMTVCCCLQSWMSSRLPNVMLVLQDSERDKGRLRRIVDSILLLRIVIDDSDDPERPNRQLEDSLVIDPKVKVVLEPRLT